ncbi:MAG: DUF1963 domain-containing protein [Paracoccaceae bacterium]|nr:DUF1963 domain-containing protein [Paracoccaceae bacterium]
MPRNRKCARKLDEFVKWNYEFDAHHLDWEFIWDWAKEFYRLCLCLTLDHLRKMQDEGISPKRIERLIRKLKKQRKDHNRRQYRGGKKLWFWTFSDPVSVDATFDWQAGRWMALSQFETGVPSQRLRDAFVDMLVEITRHFHETDDEGYNLGPRVGLLDYRVKGHDKHAGHTFVNAKDAFKVASQKAKARYIAAFEAFPQETRWDSRVIAASGPATDLNFCLGTMPLQKFGTGFEIQSAVSDNADKVLLLQIGDSFGLPIGFGPDMIVQLWVPPDDLAAARFDQVTLTADMT